MGNQLGTIVILLIIYGAVKSGAISSWSQLLEGRRDVLLLRLNDSQFLTFARNEAGLIVNKYDSNGKMLLRKELIVKNIGALLLKVFLTRENDVILLCFRKVAYNDRALVMGVKLDGMSLDKVWEKDYPGIDANYNIIHNVVLTKNGTYLFSAGTIGYNYLSVWGIDRDGNIVVEMKNFQTYFMAIAKGGEEVIFSDGWGQSDTPVALVFGPDLVLRGSIPLPNCEVLYLFEDENDTFVGLLGSRTTSGGISLVFKINRKGDVLWKTEIEEAISDATILTRSLDPSRYLLYGKALDSRSFGVRSLHCLYAENGSVAWKTIYSDVRDHLSDKIIELRPKEFVFTEVEVTILRKVTIPRYAERLRCDYINECKTCPMGAYWNYTTCVSCPRGCRECVDPQLCLSCNSGFVLVRNMECSRKPPRPKENLTVPNATEPVPIPIPPCNLGSHEIISQERCKCPPESYTNSTHCFAVFSSGCQPLCDSCILRSHPIHRHCLRCSRGSHVRSILTLGTEGEIVECGCEPGYTVAADKCVPTAVAAKTEQKPASKNVTVAVVAVAAGCVLLAGILIVLIRRWRIRRLQTFDRMGSEETRTGGTGGKDDAVAMGSVNNSMAATGPEVSAVGKVQATELAVKDKV